MKFYIVAEIAELLRLSSARVYALIDTGKLRVHRFTTGKTGGIRVSQTQLDAYLKAADVIVNLRTPLNTHMSATLMRAIATGRPVVINDLPEWRFLPDGVVRRVPVDGEVPALTEALTSLAGDPGLRSRMSADARTFYEREGTIGRMAERYLEVVGRTTAGRTTAETGRTGQR